ncbi:LysR family transcriptional regulator [Prescottella equi]|uniref:LysR family transcriptional regulator n=1 Tax=Rhodococcus hoagii TaxID=43767 RepID=UPI0023DAD426|nr:LysR family transcriptional regulator [Prescottella equi]
MDVRQLEYFLAVVDNGGINRAAEALHVAQPSLSQSIKKLERELKTSLFHRVGRGLVIAPAGEALVGPARRVLREMDAAGSAVREVRDLRSGRVDIAALSDTSTDPVSVWVAKFRLIHPDVQVRVEERDDPAEVLELVRTGAAELGITVLPAAAGELIQSHLVSQYFALVCPPGTDLGLPDPTPLEQLSEIPLVMGDRQTASRHFLERSLRAGGVEPWIAVEVPQRGAVVPMVVAGAGAAIVGHRLAAEARNRGAVVTDLSPGIERELGLIHRPGRLSEAASAFLTCTREALDQWDSAVSRRMRSGMSRLDAVAATVARAEEVNAAAFARTSPLRRRTGEQTLD